MFDSYRVNTLKYDSARCTGCGMCWSVCPHGVFEKYQHKARLARYEACMECGACRMNCPAGAIEVNAGVGCAAAMFRSALRGGKDQSEECC